MGQILRYRIFALGCAGMTTTLVHPIELYAEYFDTSFVEHVRRLQRDPDWRDAFQQRVCAGDYSQWLKSPKWKATAKLKRLLTPHCHDCGTHQGPYEMHHESYNHLGIEVLHLDELSNLCRSCHAAKRCDCAMPRYVPYDPLPAHQQYPLFRQEPGRTIVEPHCTYCGR